MSAPDNYTAASGVTIYGGMDDPAIGALPAWAAAAPLNAWMEIPGTSGAGGTSIESYSGWAKLPNGKLAITLAGGHTDGVRNSTVIIDLMVNAPAWVEIGPPSPTHTYEVAYEEDGKPVCCHTYYSTMWVPTTNRLMRFGAIYVSISGNTSYFTVDGFSLDTNTWDPAGTYVNLPQGQAGTGYNPITNKVLLSGGVQYYEPLTGAVTNIATGGINMPRAPWTWDSTRNQFFGLCFGDNQEVSQHLGVVAVKVAGATASAITIAESAARTQFVADVPYYAGMTYDPVNDCYLFYCGSRAGTAGRIYKVTPNNTTTWDMSIFSYGSGGITPAQTVASGIMSKFTYVPELNGVVMMTTKATNLYFMRTS